MNELAEQLLKEAGYPTDNEYIDPFEMTYEGLKQSIALCDWFNKNRLDLWLLSTFKVPRNPTRSIWEMERLKWCLEHFNA